MKPNILWIDDTFDNKLHDVMAYVDELEDTGGFKVDKISSADKALDILEKGEEVFVCIIIDIMMPYGNGKRFSRAETEDGTKTGIVLAKRIQQMEKYNDVPIVLLTGVRYIFETIDKNKIKFPCFFKADISTEEFLDVIQKEIKKHGGGKHV